MLAFIWQLAQINPIGNPILRPDLRALNAPWDYFNDILPTLIGIGFIIGAIVFIFIFALGAFQWLTAGGDRGKLEDARRRITHSIVGLVILLLIYFIIQLVNQILGLNIGLIGIIPPPVTQPPPIEIPCDDTCNCYCPEGYHPADNSCVQYPTCTGEMCTCLPGDPTATPLPTERPLCVGNICLNSATDLNCTDLCTSLGFPGCNTIGTDPDDNADNGLVEIGSDRGCGVIGGGLNCNNITMNNTGYQCSGISADWTYCNCAPPPTPLPTIIITPAYGSDCAAGCDTAGGYTCVSVGTDDAASNSRYWTTGLAYGDCSQLGASCDTQMVNWGWTCPPNPTPGGRNVDWTNCACEPPAGFGYNYSCIGHPSCYAWDISPYPFDLTTVGRYSQAGGPCNGKAPGTCDFDIRTAWYRPTFNVYRDSVIASGMLYDYSCAGGSCSNLNQGVDLDNVSRYDQPNGPCVGQADCRFDTRAVQIDEAGDTRPIESISVGSTGYICTLDGNVLPSDGCTTWGIFDLNDVDRYNCAWTINSEDPGVTPPPPIPRNECSNYVGNPDVRMGPCYNKSDGQCIFNNRVVYFDPRLGADGLPKNEIVESITVGGTQYNYLRRTNPTRWLAWDANPISQLEVEHYKCARTYDDAYPTSAPPPLTEEEINSCYMWQNLEAGPCFGETGACYFDTRATYVERTNPMKLLDAITSQQK
ncbi:hypothetical protein A3A76_05395 [Candidatus Woesebacteria bacterium RIFCSPLOWO2_01_FULL_39_23]|uniref:Uncharacterized protein n=2 Tax=Microgenomates group TaxID=1794810 RepID=A0A0H4T7G1_9BACT|nr:hypothetical protein [uncultured Microgenomates bacterium Rifle_16ft_4_minimus_37633]OGM27866.1 MAG: hypothetical protein A2628_05615 [Candidatus Woesebacteria bacterium RIFCSPHIGHO2_01_FULL_40_22]OGM62288.1 MAG: hypothetical protein A3A76_05395 [Candidatus Woesebacteria bacterium RIFCSPLOWO2_01_FULL_39_23]